MSPVSDWERFYLWAGMTAVYGACVWWIWRDTHAKFRESARVYANLSQDYQALAQQHRTLQDEHIAMLLERARDRQEDAETVLLTDNEDED